MNDLDLRARRAARSIHRAMEEMEMSTPIKERPPAERFGSYAERRLRNRRVGALVVSGVVVVLAVTVFLGVRERGDVTPPMTSSTAPPPPPTSGSFLLDLATGETRALPASLAGGYSYVASPDGTQVVYTTDTRMVLANIDGSDVRQLDPVGPVNGFGARWSPDGARIVYQERDGNSTELGDLVVLDVATGDIVRITDLGNLRHGWWYMAPTFTPDGRHVLFHLPPPPGATSSWTLYSVPVTGGEPTELVQDAGFAMAFPDGADFAFVSGIGKELKGDRIEIGTGGTFVEASDYIFMPTMSPDGTRIAFQDGGRIYVVDVSTRAPVRGSCASSGSDRCEDVAAGNRAEWLDADTLIVTP